MTKELTTGLTKTRSFTVKPEQTIDFMGEECRVYATPALLNDIEHACRDLIFENTPEGEDSVGTTVSIAHMAPTLVGMDVDVTVTIDEVDGRKVALSIVAKDSLDTICKGRHERFVVNVEKTRQRLMAKAEKARQS